MRLRKFRVRAYRCIHDSGEIRVGDLAAFVGRNESGKTTIQQEGKLTIIGLEKVYSISDMIQFDITVSNSDFECGDLYITISDGDQVITQSGFMKQCFMQKNQKIPLDEKYSEIITTPGEYRVLIEIFDQNYKDSLSYVANITVK